MPTDLVITEKTSQARDVRAAVGGRFGAILPAEGHLLTLQEPEDVVPAWKRWTATLLRPESLYGFKPATGGNKAAKLRAIREALRGARRVWLATDCDREGQLIGQELIEHLRFRGEVMRVMFTAQDPETIRAAFARAKPNAEYAALYAAAVARQQADQVYNLSLTRTATVTLGRGERAVIGIGRVKTPTLAIVCRRELEIRNFKPETYFEVVATARVEAGTFRMRHAPKERIGKREEAEAIAARAEGFAGPLRVKVEEKRQSPPRLHDLPSLQKLCGSRFGWSAEHTLSVAQELYDGAGKKVITYPRAETRYLPENLAADAPRIAAALRAGRSYAAIPVPAPPLVRRGKAGHFWDRGLEGASHHAVIPNVNTVGDLAAIWPRLTQDERRLFDVIARTYLAALMPDFRYRQTTATLDVSGHEFRAVGRQPIELGWREAFGADGEEEGEDRQLLPPLRDREPAALSDARVEQKETRPPPRYHEGTLIEAMQNAWQFIEDSGLRERLREAKGIGTPATRAEIIKGLKRQDLLTASGKLVVPTERGLALYGVLLEADPVLVDPGATAKLELLLDEVLVGRQSVTTALDAVCEQATRIMERLTAGPAPALPAGLSAAGGRGAPRGGARGGARRGAAAPGAPTPAMRRYAESLARQHGVALPADYATSGEACRRFLDAHAAKRGAPGPGKAAPRERPGGRPGESEGEGETAAPARARPAARPRRAAAMRRRGKAEEEAGAPAAGRASRPRSRRRTAGAGPDAGGQDGDSPVAAAPAGTVPGDDDAARKAGPGAGVPEGGGGSGGRPSGAGKPGGETARETTRLRIPFGNKTAAFALGARYGGEGWYAPPGTDLAPFRARGWL
ncbi:DNA topoisomerase [Roseomonas sp. NAR14]|uniref:DNA topoisomerase n=1 Tax=Roseomonas acroporae TaxID=2937791 RepID=A0A9X1YEI7_9PROT|nr:DNA topoisomerase [Roseomonas acroporae]MCK8784921.1 DNA topoisomerase [Roseomonas acroporae]